MKRIVGRLLQRVVVAVRGGVGFRVADRVMIQVCLERLGGVVPAQVVRPRRRSRRKRVVVAVGGGVGLRERMKRVIGRLLQRVVVAVGGGVGGFRIVDRVMIQVCLERLGGVVPAQVV